MKTLQTICKKLQLSQDKGKIVQLLPIFTDSIRTCLTVRELLMAVLQCQHAARHENTEIVLSE